MGISLVGYVVAICEYAKVVSIVFRYFRELICDVQLFHLRMQYDYYYHTYQEFSRTHNYNIEVLVQAVMKRVYMRTLYTYTYILVCIFFSLGMN